MANRIEIIDDAREHPELGAYEQLRVRVGDREYMVVIDVEDAEPPDNGVRVYGIDGNNQHLIGQIDLPPEPRVMVLVSEEDGPCN